MPEDVMSQFIAHIFTTYGPMGFPVVGLLLIIKYLLDKDKQREAAHKVEIDTLGAKVDLLQTELLKEARGNATLADEVKKILQVVAREQT